VNSSVDILTSRLAIRSPLPPPHPPLSLIPFPASSHSSSLCTLPLLPFQSQASRGKWYRIKIEKKLGTSVSLFTCPVFPPLTSRQCHSRPPISPCEASNPLPIAVWLHRQFATRCENSGAKRYLIIDKSSSQLTDVWQ
jgi:hypothetical protein